MSNDNMKKRVAEIHGTYNDKPTYNVCIMYTARDGSVGANFLKGIPEWARRAIAGAADELRTVGSPDDPADGKPWDLAVEAYTRQPVAPKVRKGGKGQATAAAASSSIVAPLRQLARGEYSGTIGDGRAVLRAACNGAGIAYGDLPARRSWEDLAQSAAFLLDKLADAPPTQVASEGGDEGAKARLDKMEAKIDKIFAHISG